MRILIFILTVLLTSATPAHAEDRVRPVTRIPPDYPADALEKEIAGKVRASLLVDDDGKVSAVEILSESPKGFGFADAAKEAFAQWTYPPNVPGAYKAAFTFSVVPLALTAEEAELPFSPPPISRVRLKYPEKALNAGAVGEVRLVVTVGASGDVEGARTQKETPLGFDFAKAAIAAVSNWRFLPGERSIFTVTLKFLMEPDNGGPQKIALPTDIAPAPEPSRKGTPKYPYKARQAGVEGVVEFGIQIDKRGLITHAAVLSETPKDYDFASNAYTALPEWRFRGAAPGTYKLVVEFKLDEQ
jgi:TonB family protein